MTNRQWLLEQMQNMSDEELSEIIKECILCELVDFKSYCGNLCTFDTLQWLKSEHKEPIKLSDAERVILENVPEEYEWIARDKNKRISIYLIKPAKGEFVWGGGCSQSFDVFTHLFQFIKWEDAQAYNIAELLKGE